MPNAPWNDRIKRDMKWGGGGDRKRNSCHTNPLTPATPKRLCNDISGQRGHRGRPLSVVGWRGGWSPGYSLGVAGRRRGKNGLWGQTNSQWSVCLGFLRGDSSSQSLSNGNQLTANKAIARLGLFAFVVDLWRWWWWGGAGWAVYCALFSQDPPKEAREIYTGSGLLWARRILSSFPKAKDLLMRIKVKVGKSSWCADPVGQFSLRAGCFHVSQCNNTDNISVITFLRVKPP